MTQVTVLQPHGDTVLTAATPLRVTGNATGKGGFEPDVVDTVTVSFDGGPPVDASLTVVPKQKIPAVLFAADVRVPGEAGPHEIRVVARLHKVDVVHGGEPAGHTHPEGTQP